MRVNLCIYLLYLHFRPRRMHSTDSACCCWRVAWSVCLCVCLSVCHVTTRYPAEMAGPMEMPFGFFNLRVLVGVVVKTEHIVDRTGKQCCTVGEFLDYFILIQPSPSQYGNPARSGSGQIWKSEIRFVHTRLATVHLWGSLQLHSQGHLVLTVFYFVPF